MEDAPTPIISDDLNEKILNTFEFKLKFENKNYNLKIKSGKDHLYLETVEENNIIYFFEVQYNLEELIQLDKIFKTCDNMDDAHELMVSNIKSDKTAIKSISEHKLILLINILQANRSVIEKEIRLTKKYNKNESVIEKLSQEIKELKISQKNLEKEISELKKENEILKAQNTNKELNDLKDRINYYFDQSIIKSTIIPEQNNFEFIKERLIKAKINKNQNHTLYFELLYKAKRHGDRAKDFHLRCDMYRNTLTIIKTKEGLIFGGFTSQTWEGNDFDKEDENAFCFSLDKHKIYNSIKGKKAIFASPNEGPCFQNCIFEVKDNCFDNGGTCDSDVKSHFDNIESEYEINGGKNNFLVEDLEVFAVYFE